MSVFSVCNSVSCHYSWERIYCGEVTKKLCGQGELSNEGLRNSISATLMESSAKQPWCQKSRSKLGLKVCFLSEVDIASASDECLILQQSRPKLSLYYNTVVDGNHIATWCQLEYIGTLLPWGWKSFIFTRIDRNHRYVFTFPSHRASGSITIRLFQNASFISMEFDI